MHTEYKARFLLQRNARCTGCMHAEAALVTGGEMTVKGATEVIIIAYYYFIRTFNQYTSRSSTSEAPRHVATVTAKHLPYIA